MNYAEALQTILAANPKAFPRLLTQRMLRHRDNLSRIEQQKIENALRALHAPPTEQEAPATTPPPAAPLTPNPETPPPPPMPPTPPAATPKASPRAIELHKRHSHHHALLVAATTDAERAEQVRIIMEDVIPALDAEYDRLRAAEGREDSADGIEFEPGNAPVLSDPDADGVQQMRRLQSLRTRIARLKNKLIPDAPNPKRRAELEKQLAVAVAEKEAIERKLAQ